MKLKLPLAMAAIVLSVPAHANIETLITIPIADILGHREAQWNYYLSGNERNIDRGYTHDKYLIVGLFDVCEVAVDNDLRGTTSWSAKFKLLESSEKAKVKYAVSGGFMNFQGGTTADTFLVGRLDVNGCRLHGGVIRNDMVRGIAGIDFPIFKDWTALAEFTSGPHGMTWAGVSFPVKGVAGLTVLVAGGFPNTKSDGIQHTMGITWGFKF